MRFSDRRWWHVGTARCSRLTRLSMCVAWLVPAAVHAADESDREAVQALSAAGMRFEAAQLVTGAPRVAALQEADRALEEALRGKLEGEMQGAAALLAGSIHFEQGNAARAQSDFKQAGKKLGKGDFADDADFARIQALEAAGRDADAMKEWSRWESRYPKSPLVTEAHLAEAWNALRRGAAPEAENLFTALVTASPYVEKDPRVVLGRATSAYLNGDPAAALTLLEHGNGDDRAIYLRGLCEVARGNLLRAAASYQEVADRYPDSPLHDAALFAKANAFLQSHAYQSAADDFTRARERMKDEGLRAEAELRAAASIYLAGAPDSATSLLRGVVERHADSDVAARAQFLVGEILRSQEHFEQAIPEYNRVLARYFEHEVAASAQYRVARCLDALGRRAEATSAYQAVVSGYALAPEAPAAAYLAGVGLLERGQPLRAAPYFQLVVDRYAAHGDNARVVFASPEHQELVEAALCLLELSYHQAGDLGQLSGAPHLLLESMPASRSTWYGYALLIDADAQAALGHYPEAQATLVQLTREFPEHEIALAANQLLAWTYARTDQDSLAIATEQRMLSRYAAHGDAHRLSSAFLHLAHVRFNQKRYREAAAGYEDFLKRFPQASERLLALYQAGLCYQRLDRAGDAVDRWEAIVRDSAQAPIAERAWARAGDVYFQAEKYADAERCYTGLLQNFAGTRAAGVAMLRLAQCEYNAGRDGAALEAFAQVIARFPDTPFAREATRGTESALYRLGQRPDGRDQLARLVEQYPTSSFAADAQFEVARQLREAKHWSEAAEAFRRVVSQFPGSPNADRAQLMLAECLGRAGDAEGSQAAYAQFLSFFPSSPLRSTVLFQLASMRFEAQDYAQAAVHFMQLLDDSTATDVRAAALFNLAQCQRAIGSTAEARASLDRYASEYPGDERAPQVAYQLGDLDEAAGDAQSAAKRYESALGAHPSPELAAELSYRIGRCQETLGDADAALRAYRSAAAVRDKNDPYRLSALARCASIYESQGDRVKATAAYRDIAQNASDPELAAAAAGRAKELRAGGAVEDAAPPVPERKPARPRRSP
jgi:TolA-binding protein